VALRIGKGRILFSAGAAHLALPARWKKRRAMTLEINPNPL
jgi:hypothetical protein